MIDRQMESSLHLLHQVKFLNIFKISLSEYTAESLYRNHA